MPTSKSKLVTGTNGRTVTTYVGAILILAIMTMAAFLAILILRPNEDNTALIAAMLGFVAPIMIALIALVQRENHMAMNSRLDQLVSLTNQLSRAEGRVEGAAGSRANDASGPGVVAQIVVPPGV